MKAIAEYFRDLAADDRYFGAEPPTPDAEMLHRIAEREIQRRVEAKINENGVVLRAHELAAPIAAAVQPAPMAMTEPVAREPVAEIAPAAPAEAAVMAAAPALEDAPHAPAMVQAADAVAAEPMTEAEPGAAPAALSQEDAFVAEDSVVAKLSRLRAAAALSRSEPAAAPAPVAAAPLSNGIYAEDLFVDDLYATQDGGKAEASSDVTSAWDEIGPSDLAASTDVATSDEPVAESIADAVADAWAAYDQPQGDSLKSVSDFLAMDEDDALDLAALAMGSDMIGEPDVSASEQLNDEAAAQAAHDDEEMAEQAGDSVEVDLSSLLGQLDPAPAEAAPAMQAPEVEASVDQALTDTTPVEADSSMPVPPASRRPRARVIKVRRSDYVSATDEPADAGTDAPDTALADALSQDPMVASLAATLGDSTLSAADQADLLMELADVTREFEPQAEAATADAPDRTESTAAEANLAPQAEMSGIDSLISAALAEPEQRAGQAASDPAALMEIADLDAETHAAAETEDAAEAGPAGGWEAVAEAAAEPVAELDAMPEGAAEAEAPAEGMDAEPRVSEGRAMLETEVEENQDAISRLFDQTDTELQGTENRRRLSAIAHLKAAVAATEADKEARSDAGQPPAGPSEMDRYRDDLAQVVRPRRPEAAMQPTRRPVLTPDRPAPLVLVSEQRIDRPATAEPSMIRPRRVMTGALAISDEDFDDEDWDDEEEEAILSDSRSFAEFAERIGASGLSDLLEAAAAYAAYVEGRPSFSRPQIMKKIAGFTPEDGFSREDGLRSFGMLLRQGKIQKVRRGQFAIAKTSRFIAEARRMAP